MTQPTPESEPDAAAQWQLAFELEEQALAEMQQHGYTDGVQYVKLVTGGMLDGTYGLREASNMYYIALAAGQAIQHGNTDLAMLLIDAHTAVFFPPTE